MEMSYDRLGTKELRGATQADYLIALDAHFSLVHGGVTAFDEPDFPVVELARSLVRWLEDPDRSDFEFDSMSFEEGGVFSIRQGVEGWEFGSIFAPGAATAPVDWSEVDRCCRRFIAKVEADLVELGLDPAEVIER